MKPRYRIALLSIILVSLLAWAIVLMAPRYVKDPAVQARIMGYLATATPVKVQAREVVLGWLPFPHLTVMGVSVESDEFKLSVPQADIYPDYLSPVTGDPWVQKVVMKDPVFHLLKFGKDKGTRLRFDDLPDTLRIENGTATISSGIYVPGLLLGDRSTLFRNCNLTLTLDRTERQVHAVCACDTPYARHLYLQASVGEDFKAFDAWARMQHLNLNRLFKHYITGRSVPDARNINLFVSVSSDRPGFYNGTVKLDAPCITLPGKRKDIDISCGVLALDIKATPSIAVAMIRQFEVENPSVRLSGTVGMKLTHRKGGDVLWDIDLRGSDIDLRGIRRVVLNLFGRSHQVRNVCNIVRGGRALSLVYRFKGNTSDFGSLEHMVIKARVDKAPIYIPAPDLLLDKASGPISIEDGVLYGSGLTATMGRSQARNGSLELGLSDHLFQFKLALDVKADLGQLQPLLERLIKDRAVVEEIRRFHHVKGSAQGHLKIGDDLRRFDVHVNLSDVKGSAVYDRLGWPVSIRTGKAVIGPHSVSWRGVSGTAGKSRVTSCSGDIDWRHEPRLHITEFRGQVNSAQFTEYLTSYPMLHEEISPVVSSLDGILSVRGAELDGPAFSPEKWRYELKASPVSIRIDSPLLPKKVRMVSGSAVLTDKRLRLHGLKVEVDGPPVFIDSDLSHHLLRQWQGMFRFSGTLTNAVEEWARDNGWVADYLMLSVPCRMMPSTLEFNSEEAHFRGGWLFDSGTAHERSLYIDRQVAKDGFMQEQVKISAPDENVFASLKAPSSRSALSFSWKGRLSAATVDRILLNNQVLKGHIDGDFALRVGQTASGQQGFDGNLEIFGLSWPWGLKSPLKIETFTITGADRKAKIDNLQLVLDGDRLDIDGCLNATSDGVRYDLSLSSPLFHRSSLIGVFGDREHTTNEQAQKGDGATDGKIDGKEETAPASDGVTAEAGGAAGLKAYGRVEYHFDRFVESMAGIVDGGASKTDDVDIDDLTGTMEVSADSTVKIHIAKGMLCGMRLSGAELLQPGKERKCSYVLTTPQGHENEFEDVESCLGIDPGMIQGPFRVNAAFDLTGDRISKGHVDIDAHDGKLRHFTMLSSIFSVVNMVDFLGKKGWQEITGSGLAYSKARLRSVIEDDILKIEKAAIFGNGLNLFATGQVNIDTRLLNVVVVVAPLKTVDAIVTHIPLVGKGFGGEHNAFITIPVSVKGALDKPEVKVLPAKTVFDILKKLIAGPLQAPFQLLEGFSDKKSGKGRRPGGHGVSVEGHVDGDGDIHGNGQGEKDHETAGEASAASGPVAPAYKKPETGFDPDE